MSTRTGLIADFAIRLAAYVLVTPVVMFVAFGIGDDRATPDDCTGDCDLGGLYGLIWSGGALVLCLLTIAGLEVLRWRRSRRRRGQRLASASADATR